MKAIVKSLETKNYTYYFSYGYGKTAKTSYKQQQERKTKIKYFIMQRGIGLLSIIIGFAVPTLFPQYKDLGMITVIMSLIGSMLLLSNNKAFGW